MNMTQKHTKKIMKQSQQIKDGTQDKNMVAKFLQNICSPAPSFFVVSINGLFLKIL